MRADGPVLRRQPQASDSSKPVSGQRVARNRTDAVRYTSYLVRQIHRMTDSPTNPTDNITLHPMRNDYLQNALLVIDDPNILINVVSRRVKQLRRGNRPLV